MPNNLSFDVAFTRKQMEKILADPNVNHVIVYGTYTFNPAKGGRNYWDMSAFAQGTTKKITQRIAEVVGSNLKSGGTPESGCIRPCP